MLYNQQYHYWVDQDPDAEPVEYERHESIADAVFAIMEELYDSQNSINATDLRKNFAYLCRKLNLPTSLLEDPNGLCVIHRKEKYPDTSSHLRAALRQHTSVLKEQLCGNEPIDKMKLEYAVRNICWEACDSMPYGQQINVTKHAGV